MKVNPLTEMHSRVTQITFQSIDFFYSLDLRSELTSKFSPTLPRTPCPTSLVVKCLTRSISRNVKVTWHYVWIFWTWFSSVFSSTIKMSGRLRKVAEETKACGISWYIGWSFYGDSCKQGTNFNFEICYFS